MKTLLEIKNEVAQEHGFVHWIEIREDYIDTETYWPEVCRRAQLECARETLKEAAEKSLKDFISYIPGHFPTEFKASITDEANIKLIPVAWTK